MRGSERAALELRGYAFSCSSTCVYAGIFNTGGAISITNSTLSNNNTVGIYSTSAGTGSSTVHPVVTIHSSSITGHTSYGVFNGDTSTVIDATNNWWGDLSGPAPYGKGNGVNYQTCIDNLGQSYICQFYVNYAGYIGQGMSQGSGGQAATYQAHVAEPVNTANGNCSYSRTELSIPTRGLPLTFARAYNAMAPQNGPLGWGWTRTWNISLSTSSAAGTASVTFGDGHSETWLQNGSTYQGTAGVFDTLVLNTDGSFSLTQKNQTVYHFTATGQLTSVVDKNGNTTTLSYDSQGRLVTVTEPAGRTLTFSYTSAVSPGLISQVSDPLGRTLVFGYDSNGQLVSATDPSGATTSQTYDSNHRLLAITDANSHTFVQNTYDAIGRVSQQLDALGNKTTFCYDDTNHKTLVTDPLGLGAKDPHEHEMLVLAVVSGRSRERQSVPAAAPRRWRCHRLILGSPIDQAD